MSEIEEITYRGVGVLSKKECVLNFSLERQDSNNLNNSDSIVFCFSDGLVIEATTDNLLNATRNTVLGKADKSICFVEHLLATISALRISRGIKINIEGAEIPLEDGSAKILHEILSPLSTKYSDKHTELSKKKYSLKEPIYVYEEARSLDSCLTAYPAENFKMTFLFEYPFDVKNLNFGGKGRKKKKRERVWVSWQESDEIEKLLHARTFGSKAENKMLELEGKALSYDEDGFDLEFRMQHEPAYHKLLDLLGDLTLTGLNPLDINAHFMSVKGSHALNTQMAKILREKLELS